MTPVPAPDAFFDRCVDWFCTLQDRIVAATEELDGRATFVRDDWQRPELDPAEQSGPVLGGWGRTRVLAEGRVFERAGVNVSCVHGLFSEDFARTMPGDGRAFRAAGISLVFHPRSPRVPTVHLNYRRLSRGSSGWFGGGADLTPYVLDADDAVHFHRVHRDACDRHGAVADYGRFKAWCDDYFRNTHRDEARGVGGIFFDHLADDPEAVFDFVRDVGSAFLDAYIARRHADEPFSEAERDWQLHRRGRYVEFNLIHDRGTLFGLKTNGRIESILMSLPPLVRWSYQHDADPTPEQQRLLEVLRVPRDWLGG